MCIYALMESLLRNPVGEVSFSRGIPTQNKNKKKWEKIR